MDSLPVLRQQSQNKIHSDFQRMKNEYNKIPPHQKSSKLLSASHPSNQHSENKDPGNSEMGRKAPVKPGISRIPVPVKSLHLPTPSDFSQSHCRWEQKSLAGKAKKKTPCTRPIPFNRSQPRSSSTANANQQPIAVSQARIVTWAVQPYNNVCNARLKTPITYVEPTKHPATSGCNVASNRGTRTANGGATGNRSQLTGQPGPSDTLQTSAALSHPLSSIPSSALHQSGATSAQNVLNAEACLENMNLLSLKDPTKTSHASQNMQPTVRANFSKSSTDKGVNLQFDHAALLSVLRDEGVFASDLGSATPHSKPYYYLPQRVMKSQQKAAPSTASIASVQFSPDSAALQSILRNEGVTGGGLVGATPRHSVCPSGRSTSIYTAQRVPVRKNLTEATQRPVAELKETPLQKWTPQRVRSTKRPPMSAMKWHMSTQPSLYPGTPGLQSCKTSPHLVHKEEVVQRLFDDQGDEPSENATEKDPETQGEQHSAQSNTTKSLSEEEVETSANSNKEKEQRVVGLQPFIQAPRRESVICFSTSKKMSRGPRFELQEGSSNHERQCPISPEQRTVQPARKETSAVSQPTCQINPAFQSLHRDLTGKKTCALSSAVVMLRKRLPSLEELFLDEEVATYTSASISAARGFLPPLPRCGNPLASTLYFEESTRFVPVDLDLSSGSSSPVQGR